jgi:hypothetical protein
MIAPPVYRSAGFDKDFSFYRTTPASVTDFFSYMTTAAVPLLVRENMHCLAFLLKKTAGLTQRPTQRKQAALHFCYKQISGLCSQYAATMIILGLKNQTYDIAPEFIYINAEEGLKQRLSSMADFDKTYKHWRGEPPVKVDNHPNPVAHKIIAGQIIEKINTLGSGKNMRSPGFQH